MSTPPDIDRDLIAQLKDAVGDASFAWLRDACIANSNTRLDDLSGAVERRDITEIRTCAHALVGLFAQFGLAAVERIAREVELADDHLLPALATALIERSQAGLRELRELT